MSNKQEKNTARHRPSNQERAVASASVIGVASTAAAEAAAEAAAAAVPAILEYVLHIVLLVLRLIGQQCIFKPSKLHVYRFCD